MSRTSAHELSDKVIETGSVIIGAGAAGLSLAGSLDGDLIVIESGAEGIDMELQRKHRSFVSGQPTNPDSVRVRAIGGATTRWTGRCIELEDYDFEHRPWIAPTGWPIDREQLAPWYSKAWDLMGVSDPIDAGASAPIEPPEGYEPSESLRKCTWRYGALTKGPNLNFANLYCGLFEKPSRRLIYAADAVEMITDGRKVQAIRFVDRGGVSRFVRARRFVLAAGCVDNISLLLHKHRADRRFLGTVEAWLGRGFMQHMRVKVGGLVQTAAQFRALQRCIGIKNSGGGQRTESGIAIRPDFARTHGLGNASAFFEYESDLGRAHPLRALAAASRKLGHTMSLRKGVATLVIDAEQAVTNDSRVTLHKMTGPSGLQRADVDWKISPTDYRTAHTAISEARRWLCAFGYGSLSEHAGIRADFIDPTFIVDSNHPLGGTRMSDNPSTGVVDRNCRVHGCENLWIVGGSVFSSGGHSNPTLTIVALALRLADHLSTQSEDFAPSGRKFNGDNVPTQSH